MGVRASRGGAASCGSSLWACRRLPPLEEEEEEVRSASGAEGAKKAPKKLL